MISLADARAVVLDRCDPIGPADGEPVDVLDALGCVLAADVIAAEAVPPFANSAMDGFAVRAADLVGADADHPVILPVVGTIAAGDPPDVAVERRTVVRIMTGAPVPPGADAIVPVEASAAVDGPEDRVALTEAPEGGRHVRPAGDDVALGDLVHRAGTVHGPAHLGVLASLDHRRPVVHRRPRVVVLSTGDELIDTGAPLRPGQIRESNRPTLVAALRRWGLDAVDGGSVPDDHDLLATRLQELAGHHDAIVTSGGVSMGDFDVVKAVLDDIADMTWMQIAIRPAKPFAFGRIGTTPVFGLPGNPVSSFVSLALLGIPGLRRMAHRPDLDLPRITVTAAEPLRRRPDDRTTFLRVDCRWDGTAFAATPVAAQGSHQLAASAGANALAILPPGDGIAAGAPVDVVLLADPFGA